MGLERYGKVFVRLTLGKSDNLWRREAMEIARRALSICAKRGTATGRTNTRRIRSKEGFAIWEENTSPSTAQAGVGGGAKSDDSQELTIST
jgi:hypothetical protein